MLYVSIVGIVCRICKIINVCNAIIFDKPSRIYLVFLCSLYVYGEMLYLRYLSLTDIIMHIIIKLLLMGLAVALWAYLIPWVEVASYRRAIGIAVVIALLNATVGFILRVLTLPLNVLTLGLVGFIITVLMIMLASNILSGFDAGGFLNASIFALVLALLGILFDVNTTK